MKIIDVNDEIELIEKPKKIEKIEISEVYIDGDYTTLREDVCNCQLKINEVIDKLNEIIEREER